jgi:hypothetical protein
MPINGDVERSRVAEWRAAEAHVRAKFPHLLPGSNGWMRAVHKRMGLR